ncbi:hypothetical protein C8R45DRAFT_966068 [Mycena sanguinolenta]|nr:hypothetical protein C8R45DRAFT_966068 [Mycena sanguinolenta]
MGECSRSRRRSRLFCGDDGESTSESTAGGGEYAVCASGDGTTILSTTAPAPAIVAFALHFRTESSPLHAPSRNVAGVVTDVIGLSILVPPPLSSLYRHAYPDGAERADERVDDNVELTADGGATPARKRSSADKLSGGGGGGSIVVGTGSRGGGVVVVVGLVTGLPRAVLPLPPYSCACVHWHSRDAAVRSGAMGTAGRSGGGGGGEMNGLDPVPVPGATKGGSGGGTRATWVQTLTRAYA